MNATNEWYDVSRLTNRSYRIVEGDGYGMFLIEGTERSVVLDAGVGVGELRSLADELVDTPVELVLTHTHWDHIGAAAQFDDVFVGPDELPADGRVAIDSLTDEFTRRPTRFVTRWFDAGNEFPDGVDPDEYAVDPFDASPAPVAEGIDLGDRSLEIHHLPGHSPGHLGVLDPETNVLYGGDVVHFDRGLYVMFDDCDLEDYRDSLARLRDLRDDGAFDVLATSHNEPISGEGLSLLDDLHRGLGEILEDERKYELVETDWGEARSYRIGPAEVLTKDD
ncbi:MBL fold metallo-hydrolase [Natrinema caseinilyticum]|uniref:MBL fold metallo-hydrolase n=1 Tax=Natrinema caseinilyticum TaxID=2961570 RepID=UPI0020C4F292|nr:MBL fold metallo-hydrolase [Natrinema caseinilyticum]